MTVKLISRRRNRQHGSALFTVTIALIAFIGLMGLAIDLGYLQLFIQGINYNGTDDFITATIMNASSCGHGGGSCGTGGSGQGSGGAVSGGGAGFIPVRLVHP